jgi:hypothetical protein
MEHTTEGNLKPVKLWKRGLNKRLWVQEAIANYEKSYPSLVTSSITPDPCPVATSSSSSTSHGHSYSESSCELNTGGGEYTTNPITPEQLRQSLALDVGDLFNITVATLFLLLVPSLLAFLTSYNTPRSGLSCRSLTYVVYAITQLLEIALWVWEVNLKLKYGAVRWSEKTRWTSDKAVCWWSQVFVGFFAILAAVGGTLMQLLGVYRSCACKVC